jgi:hypothetical protein
MSEKYTYSVTNDFLNGAVDSAKLTYEIDESTITRKLDFIGTDDDDCDIWFLDTLTSGDETVLDSIVAAHDGEPLPIAEPPVAVDGRPIVRSDSRPVGYSTMFTMRGDTASGIGDGKALFWDFSNDDDIVTEGVPDGYKMKRIECNFSEPVYIKEGTNYFLML